MSKNGIAIRLSRLKRYLFATSRKQIEDYVAAIRGLLWQRQGIFFAVFLLTAFYLDPMVGLMCYLSVIATELLDIRIAGTVDKWKTGAVPNLQKVQRQILVSTTLSAFAISSFVITFAIQQQPGGHFPPLFFLLAAALFAAMNNHQIFAALLIRELVYGVSFVTIALIDVVRFAPPIDSQIWLNFFTIIFVLYFIIDVSRVLLDMYRENLKSMKRLEREHKRVKEAYEVKSNFVSTVSHELRTPLTSIKGAIDLINSGALGPVPEQQRKILEIAGRNSVRLEHLINDVLDVQRMEADSGFDTFQPVHVAALLEEALEVNRGFAEKHGVQLLFRGASGDEHVLGDERRLMQVVTNLLSNAVKFSNESGMVEVWSEVSDGKVRICVRDDGIGIPQNSRHKVFGHFTQVDSSDQRRKGGSGLGMSISKQIIDKHGGVIDYESELGNGSTFFIALDVCSDDRLASRPSADRDLQELLPAAQ
ncbi:sensor histidine kinase [Marimonas lutisalis]|uniref:sensor histidine kinase n=1 Tax=Marimonas lutisalis TaxID=2545756 RepID=UPI0019614E6E|nr:HAMP domain-containing sensor histidine kinase [Marimonas lutisalis]